MHNDIAVISESDTRLGEQLAFNTGNKVGLFINFNLQRKGVIDNIKINFINNVRFQ